MRDLIECEVHLVTDRGLSKGRSTLEIVEAAVRGGVSVVQLREKDLETRDFYEEGLKIRDLLRSQGILFIVNDRIDLALALDADGVHVGQSDMPVEIARKILGPDKIIGLSVEEPSHINEPSAKYADYLGVSPIFVTSTKPELESGWGLDGLQKARSMTDLPLVAIGSINSENAGGVISAGADSVAVVSAIVSADDPQQAARSLVEKVRNSRTRRI
jgi:thiamine-phosphate pyrophosphorylase